MKNVLLSADNAISVYAVPDEVADHLEEYCLEFSCNWLHKSPDAVKYRVQAGDVTVVRYDERDFINYLNRYVCDTESVLVTTLEEVYDTDRLPEAYAGLPCFHF